MTIPEAEPIELTNLHEWAWRTHHQLDRRGDVCRGDPGLRDLPALLWPSLEDPIFVVGAPRSGTSFLGYAIGALPGISYQHEPTATKSAVRYVHEGEWSMRFARLYFKTVYRWLLRLTGEAGQRFAEKTPRNCLIVPFLAETFPDARFVHIIRDGRDAAVSLSRKPWLQKGSDPEADSYVFPRGPYPRSWVEKHRRQEFRDTDDVHRCIWAWRSHVENARDGARHLDPDRYTEIRYEDLPTSHGEVAEHLADFLDLGPDARDALEEELSQAHGDSIGQWRDTFDEGERRTIEAEAGELLEELGYEWDTELTRDEPADPR